MATTLYEVGSDVSNTGSPLAGGITNASITYATARPYSLSTMDVSTGLTYDAINRKLQVEAVLDSVFVDVGQPVAFTGEKKVMVPDACIAKFSGEAGANSWVIPIENPLAGAGRGGTAEPMQSFERQSTLEYMKIYYNEYSQGVIGEKWGRNFNALDIFKYYAGEQPRLSRWFAEDEDKQYHEALLQLYAWPLAKTGSGLTQGYNNNWFIANTDPASQPTYSNTLSTFRTNINTAFAAADTGTSGVNANIDLDYLIYLDSYAKTNKKIKPVTIGGKQSYLVLLPSPQYYKLLRTTSGQLGEIWTQVNRLSAEEQSFPGIVGRVMSLVIVEDTRYPTLTCTNSYGNNTHTIQYVYPGNVDARNKAVYASDSNAAWDIGFLMGQGAIADWTVKSLHYEVDNSTEYGKRYGKAAFCERGIQCGGIFDSDTASNLNIKNFSSIVLAFSAATLSVTA